MSRIKIFQDYDIAIIGSGLSGLSAGIVLSGFWPNKRIILVDPKPTLGWEATWGCKSELRKKISPIADSFIKSLSRLRGWKYNAIDAPIAEIFFHRVITNLKIDILYYAYPVGVLKQNDKTLNSVIFGTKNGYIAIQSDNFIDVTDNGSILQKCGIRLRAPANKPFSMRFFMNCIEGNPRFPNTLSTDGIAFSVHKSVWDTEIIFESGAFGDNIGEVRKSIIPFLAFIRKEIKGFQDGNLTHSSHIVFPEYYFEYKGGIKVENIKNLFCAGSYLYSLFENKLYEDLPLNSRILIGELSAAEIAKYINKQKVKTYGNIPSNFCIDGQKVNSQTSEILVGGAGTAGALAAISAARHRANVTLIEPFYAAGGTATVGAIHSYCAGIKGGLQDELDERVDEISSLLAGEYAVHGFHPEAKKVVLQEMLDEAGVDVKFGTSVVDCSISPLSRRVISVTVANNHSEVTKYIPKLVIDSTGDADIAALAGAKFRYGRETEGVPHSYSQPAGFINCDNMQCIVNRDAGFCDVIDTYALTQARVQGINQFYEKQYTENNRLIYIAPLIGIRSSRFIEGEYTLTLADEIEWREFNDKISYFVSFFDDHDSDYENETKQAMLWVWGLGCWAEKIGAEVPYRCMLPRYIEGMLIACRALSLTHDAHYGFRMQRDIQRIGEVAGIAAALSVKKNILPRNINIKELQTILYENGSLYKDEKWKIASIKKFDFDYLKKKLFSEHWGLSVWYLVKFYPEKSSKLFKRYLHSKNVFKAYTACLGLGLLNDRTAVPKLIEFVKNREQFTPNGRRCVPIWIVSILLLGMLRAKEVTQELEDFLIGKDKVLRDAFYSFDAHQNEGKIPLDAFIAAVRVLAEIGSCESVYAIKKVLRRKDMDFFRFLPSWSCAKPGLKENVKWKLDMAVANALITLHNSADDILKKYVNDSRSYVRRYARRLLKKTSL